MIQRIVLFQFKLETSDAEIKTCVDMMEALPAQIAEILRYDVAFNRRGRNERYYVSLVASFDDDAALERYESHPANKAFVRHLIPHVGATTIFDSESP